MNSFNLLDEPWIPLAPDGRRVSLLTLLQDAAALKEIKHSSPLVTIAIYRMVLAFLHRALEGPEDTDEVVRLLRAGKFPAAKLKTYAEKVRDRFDLFDSEKPFYQVAGLPAHYADPWTRLTAEFGSGNTSFLFNHTRRSEDISLVENGIPPAESACRLLEFQSFALGGLMKRFVTSTPAALGVGRALMLGQGESLFETLCFNLVPYPASERKLDSPVWERAPYTIARLNRPEGLTEPCRGITGLYTWFSRSVLLLPSDSRVRQIRVAAGAIAESTVKDPMVATLINDKGETRPLSFREDRELWRDYHGLLPHPQKGGSSSGVSANTATILRDTKGRRRPAFKVFGMTNSKAKVTGARVEYFELPLLSISAAVLSEFVKSLLNTVEECRGYLRVAGLHLARKLLTHGERDPLAKDVSQLAESFPHMTHFLGGLHEKFLHYTFTFPETEQEFYASRQDFLDRWTQIVRAQALAAFQRAARASGDNAHALKAAFEAERFLIFKLPRKEKTECLTS